MKLKLKPPIPPMEALSVETIPEESGWQYEPKWDGFRSIAFRDGASVYLQSKGEKPLGRYFPEIVGAVGDLKPKQFVLDGEIAVPVGGRFDFDQLLQRIHPAASRIKKLSKETPALFIVFDMLAGADGRSDMDLPLRQRREHLEEFARRHFKRQGLFRLSPATTNPRQARKWFQKVGGNLDGIVAKRLESPYLPGERTAVQKIKLVRTADCVVGGFRFGRGRQVVGSLLLGLYDGDGLLDHVGFTSTTKEKDRSELTARLRKLVSPPGFTGSKPGGPSRWSTERSGQWQPVKPELVAEVAFNHFSAGRFRHGTQFLRWRPDKAPRQCTFEQIARHGGTDLRLLG
jgi:ATP-dependent DNA ligase